jgi:hypothetical protein
MTVHDLALTLAALLAFAVPTSITRMLDPIVRAAGEKRRKPR